MPSLEITVEFRDATRGTLLRTTDAVTTTGSHRHANDITVGLTEETLTILADVTGGEGPGTAHLQNMDDTNYIQIGFATTVYSIRLAPLRVAIIPLDPGVTELFLKANTAACILSFDIREA